MPETPQYKAHLFICTNERKSGECCAHKNAQQLRDALKARCKNDPQLRHVVRINNSGCLDQCAQGVTAVLYPQGKWFTHLTSADVDLLLREIGAAVEGK